MLRNTERGTVSNEAIFVKYYPDFKLSPGNLERKLKFYFVDNILDTYRYFNNSGRLKNNFPKSSYKITN